MARREKELVLQGIAMADACPRPSPYCQELVRKAFGLPVEVLDDVTLCEEIATELAMGGFRRQ